MSNYDAILLISFGGPEKKEDVLPFLRNVVRGKNVPESRLQQVAEHYYALGGKSPINEQNRMLLRHLKAALRQVGVEQPIYWGNRNWHPMLTQTVAQMKQDGVQHALAFATSAFSSYSGCRQYLEDIVAAQSMVVGAPRIDKIPPFFEEAGFIRANIARLQTVLQTLDPSHCPHVLFSAHSIPIAMATCCNYEVQLKTVAHEINQAVGVKNWHLVFQSRSGPPQVPWLEPDINDAIRDLARDGVNCFVVSPLGFVSDHMEVKFDLGIEATATAKELGVELRVAQTVGTHPDFITGLANLIASYILADHPTAKAFTPCSINCCAKAMRPNS